MTHEQDTRASRVVRLERAMRLADAATVAGVRLHARAWARRTPHVWNGPPVEHDRPVVVVGGYGSSVEFYQLLATSLEHAGVRRVAIMPPVENALADIRVSARRLESMVALLGDDVDIVGHSEGGLMARWFVQQLGGSNVVRHLVTLGTPNRGLPVRIEDYPRLERYATARRLHQAVDTIANRTVLPVASLALRQMFRGSEFMQQLAEAAPASETEHLAVRSRWDGVVPYSSADLPDAPNVANVALTAGPVRSHHAAIASTSAEAFNATMTFIRRP